MQHSEPIAILLSTYNSEAYLKEQLDSLLNQTDHNFVLYICDDGSTDGTLRILETYEKHNEKIKYLQKPTTNQGALLSYAWLLENVEAEYYMFCDHDDVWLPQKIEKTFKKYKDVEEKNKNKPILVYTDLYVVDENLQIIDDSFWTYSKMNPYSMTDFKHFAVKNIVTGCTMLFNKQARNVSLPISPAATMHDAWIALNVINNDGIVDFISEPTILYRQHGQNAIGAKKHKDGLAYRLRNLEKSLSGNKAQFQMLKQIRKISIVQYLYWKIKYR
jgi:glycosyltransferase involved in cell wall biosynthesis